MEPGITYMATVQWQRISGSETTMWMDRGAWQPILGLAITMSVQTAVGSRDTEAHSGSRIAADGGIGMEMAAIQGMDGKGSAALGITLMVQDIW